MAKKQRSPVTGELPSFVVGKMYTRKTEITGRYGGNGQSGIAQSRACPAIFVFMADSGEHYGYSDHFDERGWLTYTGEGRRGDMMLKGSNLAIVNHAADGRAMHVFVNQGSGKCEYKGEFVYVSHALRRGPDRDGKDREIIQFHLMPVSSGSYIDLSALAVEETTSESEEVSLEVLRQRALAAVQPVTTVADKAVALRQVYKRSQQVRRYVLARANGYCELCEQPAPFLRKDGSPYLETHHINRLSDGGLDHPDHMAALCANCHREVHLGEEAEMHMKQLQALRKSRV